MRKNILSIVIICIVCLVLFYKPISSGQPLGLDALGHLSKVSYLKAYTFAAWDMSWYSGTLFLKLYAPLFYYLAAIFPNTIFAVNFLSFLSILLCSLGIYFFVKYKTHNNQRVSILSSLSFLTVLSISFYYVVVGNHPWVASLWALPFSLYFLERHLRENKKKDFVIFSLIFATGILLHILVGFLIGILMIIRIVVEGANNISNIKRIISYGIIPVLISSFWLFPFLTHGSNFLGGYMGQLPDIGQIFGFNNDVTWGNYSSGIGILFYLFIFSLIFLKKYYKEKRDLFLPISIAVVGFVFFGGLLWYYPYGVEPVRFILPFSILLSIFVGVVFDRIKILNNNIVVSTVFLILAFGLILNFFVIDDNYERFAYYKSDSRYGIFQDIIKNGLPIEDKFNNYRFGTSKFVFGENINYFYPRVSQTFGYQDAGMLNAPRYYDMRWHIWFSDDIDGAVYWLDWFAIKYFESENSDSIGKFENDARFRKVMTYSKEYNFTLFEYTEAKHIIALVDYLNDSSIGKEKEFSWERTNPDEAIIKYDIVDENDMVLFKEFYHRSWKAKDLVSGTELNITKVGPGFMGVYPKHNSKGVIFYQTKTIEELLGILLTFLGIIALIKYTIINRSNTPNIKVLRNYPKAVGG